MNKLRLKSTLIFCALLCSNLLLSWQCSAVPTADRYNRDGANTETNQSDDKNSIENNSSTPIKKDHYFNGEEVFPEVPPLFVRIPEKVAGNQLNGLYWYRFENAEEDTETLYEVDGYSVNFFSTQSAETADSIITTLQIQTGMDDIYSEMANNRYFLYYGRYRDFATCAEAAIKLHQLGFRETIPVLKKLQFIRRD